MYIYSGSAKRSRNMTENKRKYYHHHLVVAIETKFQQLSHNFYNLQIVIHVCRLSIEGGRKVGPVLYQHMSCLLGVYLFALLLLDLSLKYSMILTSGK